jgi:hypothetical protein
VNSPRRPGRHEDHKKAPTGWTRRALHEPKTCKEVSVTILLDRPGPDITLLVSQPLSPAAETLMNAALMAPIPRARETRLGSLLADIPPFIRNFAVRLFVELADDWRRLRAEGDDVNARRTWQTLERHAAIAAVEVDSWRGGAQ